MQFVANTQQDGLLSVDGEIGLVGYAFNAHFYMTVSSHHHRPDRKQMRTDWRDDHCVYIRNKDWPVRIQCISGGACWSGDNHSVGTIRGRHLIEQPDGELSHTGDCAL